MWLFDLPYQGGEKPRPVFISRRKQSQRCNFNLGKLTIYGEFAP
jgi:hypothetical protein